MYKKYRILSLIATTVVLAGCYTDELRQMHEDLASLEDEKIATLEQQSSSVKASIADLNTLSASLEEYMKSLEQSSSAVDKQLEEAQQTFKTFKESIESELATSAADYAAKIESLKSALQSELAAAQALIPGLQDKDAAIKQMIQELEAYIKSGVFGNKTWAEGTFATLEKQNKLIAEIEDIKAQIQQLNKSSEEMNESLKKMIEDAFKEFRDNFSGKIATESQTLTNYYLAALDKMDKDFGESNAKMILDAIDKSETSVTSWINDKLDDYVTVEAATAKINAFDMILGMVPDSTSLQEEINAAETAIHNATSAVQEAYGLAITSAIEEHEGKITKMSADSIDYMRTNVLNPLKTRVSNISKNVQDLWEQVSGIETKIKTAEDQVAAIQTTLAVLKTLDKTLKEYVESVKAELSKTDTDNNKLLNDMLDELGALISSKDSTSLQSQISALKAYIGEIPAGKDTTVTTWINTSIETLNAQFETYALLTTVNEYFTQISSTLDSHRGSILSLESKISSLLNDSENTIKGWLEEKLASYTDAATTDGILSALEQEIKTLFEGGDQTLNTNYSALVEKFTTLKATLKTEYETAITNAIAQHGGYITSEIQSALSKLDTDIKKLESDVTEMQSEVTALQGNIATFTSDIETLKTSLQTYLAFFNVEGYETLASLISDLWSKLEALDTTYASKSDFDKLYAYVQGDLTTEAGKVKGLVSRLQAVNNRIDKFDAFLSEYSLDSAGLKGMLNVITNKVDSLKKEVNGTGAIDPSLQSQITMIDSIFYGKGKTPENPAKNSLMGLVNRLCDQLVLNQLSSISYVPKYLDKQEILSYDGDHTVTASFYFLIRPSSIVKLVGESNATFKMKFTPTLTKAGATYEFEKTSIYAGTDGVLNVEVSESRPAYTQMLLSGASAALFADIYNDYDELVSSFSSSYVPLVINGSQNIHVNVGNLFFKAAGETKTIEVDATDPYWLVRNQRLTDDVYSDLFPPSWVHISPTEPNQMTYDSAWRNYYSGKTVITVTADCNPTCYSRNGVLTFRIIEWTSDGEYVTVHVEQEGNTIYSTLSAEGETFSNNKITVTLINEDELHPYIYLSKRELASSLLNNGSYAIDVYYTDEGGKLVAFPESKSTAIKKSRVDVTIDASSFTLSYNNFNFSDMTFSTPIEFSTISEASESGQVGSTLQFMIDRTLFNFWDKDIK